VEQPGAWYRAVRARTVELRKAVLDLDLAVSRQILGCDPECFRTHRFHTPLVPLALVQAEPQPGARWIPDLAPSGDIRLAVAIGGRLGTDFVLPERTRLEHAAHQDVASAYFQRQTEHIYRVVDGRSAGTWVIALREGGYGPTDLLMAAWMIVPVHPPTEASDLGPKILEAVAAPYAAALDREAELPWSETELGRQARLKRGVPGLVAEVVDGLWADSRPAASLREVLGIPTEDDG
jgi:hypothetical protein